MYVCMYEFYRHSVLQLLELQLCDPVSEYLLLKSAELFQESLSWYGLDVTHLTVLNSFLKACNILRDMNVLSGIISTVQNFHRWLKSVNGYMYIMSRGAEALCEVLKKGWVDKWNNMIMKVIIAGTSIWLQNNSSLSGSWTNPGLTCDKDELKFPASPMQLLCS